MAKELAGLISAPTAVTGAISVEPGHVYVIMKNGRTNRVVRVGQRRRPGLGIPVFGDVEVVAVVTGRREAVVKVLNVSTADGFRMPSLDARVTISIAGDDNFRDFKKAVDRDGYAFVGRVETVLRTSVERIVRQRLGELSHRFLYGMAPADLFRDVLDVRLADGLLALHSMDEIVCEWDPKFIQVYDVARETAAVKAKGAVAMAKEETKAEVMVARIRSLTPIAEALGQPVDWLLDPKLRRGAERQAFELARTAMQNPAVMRRFPELQSTVQAIIRAGTPTAMPTISPTLAAYGDAGHRHTELPRIMNVALPSPAPERTGGAVPLPELVRDETLVSIWEHCGGDSQGLHGIAGAVNRGRANVIVVSDVRPPVEVFTELRPAIARSAGVEPGALNLTVLSMPKDLDSLVSDYLMNRLFFVNNAVTIRVAMEQTPDELQRLKILLASRDGSARQLMKSINDPLGLILEPLTALLPVTGIDAVLDHVGVR